MPTLKTLALARQILDHTGAAFARAERDRNRAIERVELSLTSYRTSPDPETIEAVRQASKAHDAAIQASMRAELLNGIAETLYEAVEAYLTASHDARTGSA